MNDRDSSAWRTRDGSSLSFPWTFADEDDRRSRPVDRADVLVEQRLHSQLVQDVVGNFAEVVGRQHFLVVGHRLIAGVDVGEQRHEIRQQQEPQPDEIDRDAPAQAPARARRRRRPRCSRLANFRLLSSLVSCSTQLVVQAQSR